MTSPDRKEVVVEKTPIRFQITRLINSALDNEGYDAVGKLEGIEIVQRSDEFDPGIFCAEYVFWYVLREPWAKPFPIGMDAFLSDMMRHQHPGIEYIPDEFREDPLGFLIEHGYEITDIPTDGNIVAYRKKLKESRYEYIHFGLWTDGKVRSKFGDGHAYIHDLNKVPENYGDEVIFLKKVPV